jgi:hypothetical protein
MSEEEATGRDEDEATGLDEEVAARCPEAIETGMRRSSSSGPALRVDAEDASEVCSTLRR